MRFIYFFVFLFLFCAKNNAQEVKFGFLNSSNEWEIPAQYDYVQPFSEGVAAVTLNGKQGYIDKKGKKITKL